MAAVLLRRLLSSAFEEVYPALSPDDQTSIKSGLLLIIQLETQSSMRKKICDIVAELARNLIGTLYKLILWQNIYVLVAVLSLVL